MAILVYSWNIWGQFEKTDPFAGVISQWVIDYILHLFCIHKCNTWIVICILGMNDSNQYFTLSKSIKPGSAGFIQQIFDTLEKEAHLKYFERSFSNKYRNSDFIISLTKQSKAYFGKTLAFIHSLFLLLLERLTITRYICVNSDLRNSIPKQLRISSQIFNTDVYFFVSNEKKWSIVMNYICKYSSINHWVLLHLKTPLFRLAVGR